jgi:DNA repair exonuclease SbcCD nuclease subunit
MEFRFIHTAGWLLGLEFPHVYAQAPRLRQARLDAVDRVLALAEHEKAQAVVVAGHVFVDNRIDRKTIEALAERLHRSRVPVFLLPGINDPYLPDSPYLRYAELFRGKVLTEPTRVGNATLLPLAVRSREATPDWDFAETDSGFRVGVACAPPEDVPDRLDLDYLALGYAAGPAQQGAGWYSGSPEPTDFGHRAGKALCVTLGEGPPQVLPRDTALFHWAEVDSPEELLALPRPLETLARVPFDVEPYAGRFLYLESRPHPQTTEFHTPLLQKLAALIDRCDDPDVAAQARLKLQELLARR